MHIECGSCSVPTHVLTGDRFIPCAPQSWTLCHAGPWWVITLTAATSVSKCHSDSHHSHHSHGIGRIAPWFDDFKMFPDTSTQELHGIAVIEWLILRFTTCRVVCHVPGLWHVVAEVIITLIRFTWFTLLDLYDDSAHGSGKHFCGSTYCPLKHDCSSAPHFDVFSFWRGLWTAKCGMT